MSEKVTDYQVIAARGGKELIAAVKRAMGEGWEPLGGVATFSIPAPKGEREPEGEDSITAQRGTQTRFAQAMVKRG